MGYFALLWIDFWIGKSKNWNQMETVKREGIDIVLRWISKSMLARCSSRLEKSKQIVSQIINQLGMIE
jgi:Ca-activated chloride channel family protein